MLTDEKYLKREKERYERRGLKVIDDEKIIKKKYDEQSAIIFLIWVLTVLFSFFICGILFKHYFGGC